MKNQAAIHEFCEKIQLNNSFETILYENVPYSVAVENITMRETKEYVQSVCNAFM